MALDGIYLYSILSELKGVLLNGKVDKINQPEKDELILQIRGMKSNYKLLLSASSTYPRIHLTKQSKPNPIQAPMFCMLLRKYLSNAKIIDLRQLQTDRVLLIDFENTDDLGFHSVYTLIVEIMGRHSNITLIRGRDGIIMDSIKHITPDINSFRSLYPGIEYQYPPVSTKLNPFSFEIKDLESYITENSLILDSTFLSKAFTGVGKGLSKEFYYRIEKNIDAYSSSTSALCEKIHSLFSPLEQQNFQFASYKDKGNVKDFYCCTLHTFDDLMKEEFTSPSELLENFYFEKDKQDRLNGRSADIQKVLDNNIDRCNKKIHILHEILKECTEKDTLRLYGELLTANMYAISKGDSSAKVLNYYSEDSSMIEIPLNEHKTPSENVQLYFKKYNKLKKSEEMALQQITATEEELSYLFSVLTNVKNVENYMEIEEIRNELKQSGYIKINKSDKNKKLKPSKPLHYLSSDGLDIYVGKNNLQNDYLTLKFASKQDIWFHTKNIPGSHVIIKVTGEVSSETLEEAANLAAYYSKAKDSSSVPVDYTEIKNIRKPSGSKPGMVIYYTNKTIYVTPKETTLQKIE